MLTVASSEPHVPLTLRRPGDEQKISLTFCKDKPSIMPTLFCTKGGEIMIKFDFLNKALDMCILIIRQADMISAGRFF